MKKISAEPIANTDKAPGTNLIATPASQPRLHSTELFGTAREIVIEHAGDEYRLRLTRQGKLILTK
jgi:hemin uptake protein HemP